MTLLPILAAVAALSQPGASHPASAKPPAAPPPELWRGALVGMPLAQVQAMFPKGYGAGGTGVEGGGAPGWAMAEQVYGRSGIATFYFRSGLLSEVLVELNDVKPNSTRTNFEQARDLKAALSDYYGKPATCVDTDKRGLDRLDCRWEHNGVQVGLSYQDFGGQSPVLDVAVKQIIPKPYNPGAIFGRKAKRL
jgi:hypothetical protein